MLLGAGGGVAGEWTGTGTSSYTTTSTKTSQRTYIDADGTEVTEVSYVTVKFCLQFI